MLKIYTYVKSYENQLNNKKNIYIRFDNKIKRVQ